MDPSRLQLVKVKLSALKRTLENASEKEKGSHISRPMADNFNGMIDEISRECPTLKDALPKPVTSTHFRRLGIADATYLDLAILVEQTIAILEQA